MAVTHGHGNPSWTRDEVILALELYFECKGKIPGQSDPRVKALSELLRAFPHHSVAARKKSFRNLDGVAFKLQNIRQVATGKGLGNVSRIDREVWDELGRDPGRVKYLAGLIRANVEIAGRLSEELGADDVFLEGKIVTEVHVRRERDPRLRKRLVGKRRKDGGLSCDICRCTPPSKASQLHEAVYEVHHLVPLSAGQERTTRLEDLALLCANCHRMIHCAIAQAKRWLSIAEAKIAISERCVWRPNDVD